MESTLKCINFTRAKVCFKSKFDTCDLKYQDLGRIGGGGFRKGTSHNWPPNWKGIGFLEKCFLMQNTFLTSPNLSL